LSFLGVYARQYNLHMNLVYIYTYCAHAPTSDLVFRTS